MTISPAAPDDWGVYLFFPPSTTLEVAIARYTARIGSPPARWFAYNNQIWLGPAPDEYVLRQPKESHDDQQPQPILA